MPKRKMIDLPTLRRAMDVVPASLDNKTRTVDISLGKGVPVLRYDWWEDQQWYEVLSMDPAHVRMGRLQSGSAPLCKDHQSQTIDGQIGVIRSAAIQNGEIIISTEFSARPDVEPIFQDVRAGIIKNASVGYNVYRFQDITLPTDPIKTLLAVDWEPFEGSLVAVGADAGAGVRSQNVKTIPCEIIRSAESAQGDTMPPDTTTAAPAAQIVPPASVASPVAPAAVATPVIDSGRAAEEASRAATEAERARVVGITESVRKAGLPANVAEDLVSRGVSLDLARAHVIDKLSERTAQTQINPVFVVGGGSNAEARMRHAEASLLHRFRPDKFKLEGDAREFRGLTLAELARSFLEARGVRTTGLSKNEIATRAFEGVSDFPALLANVANKTLRDAYQGSAQTWKPIAKPNFAADFKQMSRVQLSDAPSLEIVNSSGEVKKGALTDGKEVYSLATYAKIVPINRQAIINDDTSAFTRIPALMGVAASDLESDTVWGLFSANANMGDGNALFSSAHKNNTSSGTAISVTSMGVGRASMKSQKNLQSRPMNIMPKFIICEPNTESLAEQVIGPIVPNASTSFNPFMGKYTILSEPRVTVASGAQPWYLSAEPGQIDVIEYSYLEGQEGVYLESKQGFEVDGVELKVRLDFAAKILDWRGLYRNVGV